MENVFKKLELEFFLIKLKIIDILFFFLMIKELYCINSYNYNNNYFDDN